METVRDFILGGSKITADGNCSHQIKRCLLLGRKIKTNLDSLLKSRDFTDKGPSSQSYDFSSSHVWMWELNYLESWVLKNWCFRTVVLEKILERPLDSKEIRLSILKEISPSNEYSGLISFRIDWFDLLSLLPKGLSSVFSSTTMEKHQFFGTQSSLWSNFHIHTWLLCKGAWVT